MRLFATQRRSPGDGYYHSFFLLGITEQNEEDFKYIRSVFIRVLLPLFFYRRFYADNESFYSGWRTYGVMFCTRFPENNLHNKYSEIKLFLNPVGRQRLIATRSEIEDVLEFSDDPYKDLKMHGGASFIVNIFESRRLTLNQIKKIIKKTMKYLSRGERLQVRSLYDEMMYEHDIKPKQVLS